MSSAESRRKKAEGQLMDGRQGLLDGQGTDGAGGEATDGVTERIVADEVPDEHLPAFIRQQIGGQGVDAEGVHAGQVAVKGGFGTAATVVLKETLLVDACLAHDLQDFVEPRGGAGIDDMWIGMPLMLSSLS